MKVAHKNKKLLQTEENWELRATGLEREGELAAAAEAWNKVRIAHPLRAKSYDRLMIIYRKLKEYDKELKVINSAISAFHKKHKEQQISFPRKITVLSKALLKATGLADKKGNNIYRPGEVEKWEKRKELLLKRKSNV